jgi:hypothetical protein
LRREACSDIYSNHADFLIIAGLCLSVYPKNCGVCLRAAWLH